MTGISTDNTIEIEAAPNCTFCKTPRSFRAYVFCNEALDAFICDVCIVALGIALKSIGDPHPYRPQGKPN